MCPISPAERRLDDSVLLWDKALHAYFEPEQFRINLQAAIQSFRSVTFVLQKQKSQLANFDAWYLPHQARMKADPKMRWLIAARNFIEKEGDLTTNSRFLVTLSNSWNDQPSIGYPLSPEIKAEDVAKLIANTIPEAKINDEALLRFERRWVDSLLPDEEVLSTLVHCYRSLRKLLMEAHSLLGSEPRGCSFEERVTRLNEVLPSTMEDINSPRVAWYKLSEGKMAYYDIKKVSLDRDTVAKAAERYPELSRLSAAQKETKHFKDVCYGWFSIARTLLERDGYHVPMAMLETEGGPVLQQFRMDDRADKHVMMRELADHCSRTGADSCIFITEAWTARLNPQFGPHAANYPNRGEALVLHAIHQDGTVVELSASFTKTHGIVFLGPTVEIGGAFQGSMKAVAKAILKKS